MNKILEKFNELNDNVIKGREIRNVYFINDKHSRILYLKVHYREDFEMYVPEYLFTERIRKIEFKYINQNDFEKKFSENIMEAIVYFKLLGIEVDVSALGGKYEYK